MALTLKELGWGGIQTTARQGQESNLLPGPEGQLRSAAAAQRRGQRTQVQRDPQGLWQHPLQIRERPEPSP